MRIIACFKATPDDADITISRDGSLDVSRASWRIGSYDLNAIEAARQLADQLGAEVLGLTLGGAQLDSTKLRKDALSRGLDQLTIVTGDPDGDSFQTASLLAGAIVELGEVDLVLLGAGSSDRYAQQVGNILGGLLGLPTLNAVDKVEPAGGGLRVERTLESQTQVLAVDLPAVLSVTSGINAPRIPGMRDILSAGKKPVTVTTAEPPAASTRLVSVQAPQQQARQQKVIEGEPAEVAAQLAAFITSL